MFNHTRGHRAGFTTRERPQDDRLLQQGVWVPVWGGGRGLWIETRSQRHSRAASCGLRVRENDLGTSPDRQQALLFVLHDDSGAVMPERYSCYTPENHRYDSGLLQNTPETSKPKQWRTDKDSSTRQSMAVGDGRVGVNSCLLCFAVSTMSFSRASLQPRDQRTSPALGACGRGGFFTVEAPGKPSEERVMPVCAW